mmetsp:Transcript_31886/g.42116  ORF Transcript_31886/g.42116 Transcript_31886/m.42116 type:complete len:385 (+) Transcript_31886:166-1320(+)
MLAAHLGQQGINFLRLIHLFILLIKVDGFLINELRHFNTLIVTNGNGIVFKEKALMAQLSQQIDICESGLVGGEWAGWECKFSQQTGEPIPIPEDYIPSDLLEWGVQVLGFEVLTSENLLPGIDELEGEKAAPLGDSGLRLYRKRGMVYPETGCALDNLQVQPTSQEVWFDACSEYSDFRYFPGTGYAAHSPLLHPAQSKEQGVPQSIQLESCLHISPGSGQEEAPNDRAKIIISLDTQKWAINKAIQITKERKYAAFDDGELYKGGGLDTRTLTNLIGAPNCFAEKGTLPLGGGASEAAEASLLIKGGFFINYGNVLSFSNSYNHLSRLDCSKVDDFFAIEVGWESVEKEETEGKDNKPVFYEKRVFRVFNKNTLDLILCTNS